MSFSSDSIRVLRVIAETGSFSEAAGVLHRVPSAVSYAVKRMEDELNVKLFVRGGKTAVPTPACRYLLSHSAWILRSLSDLEHGVAQIANGVDRDFKIALNYIVNPKPATKLISLLTQRFPYTDFSVRTEVYNGCWDALYQGRADFVIGAPQTAPSMDGIGTRYLGEVKWSFTVGSRHPLATQGDFLHTELVRKYPSVVVLDTSTQLVRKRTWELSGQKVIEVADLQMVLEMVKANVGIGFLPNAFIQKALQAGDVVVRSIDGCKQPVPVFYAWRTQRKGVLLEALLDCLANEFSPSEWLG